MNEKITNFFKTTRKFLGKHSPEILTGIGVTGMITTTVLAVKATPKALELIEEEKNRQNRELVEEALAKELEHCEQITKLNLIEVVKVAWKPYIPAVTLGIASVSCIVGASAVNHKRNAALATAYAISERTLVKYRDKVIETLGEKKDKEIKEKIAQDQVNENKVSDAQVILTSKGDTLCLDSISGRYFKSDIDKIRKVVNELNRQLLTQNYISLNELYYELGLEPIKTGSYLGWNVYDGLIELDIKACLAEDDQPCLVIGFNMEPKYDYDKLM